MAYPVLLLIAAAFLAYRAVRLFTPPKGLAHLPAISLLQYLVSLLRAEPYDVLFERIMRPALAKAGVARMWIQGGWGMAIANPEDIKEILLRSDVFLKRRQEDPNMGRMLFRRVMGLTNLVFSDGEEWRRHRRVASPAFKKSLSTHTFVSCTAKLVALIREGGNSPQDIHDLFRRLTLDVLGEGLFSHDFRAIEEGKNSKDLRLYQDVMKAAFDPFYLFFPRFEGWLPSRRESLAKGMRFREFLRDIVDKRKGELTADHDDLLSAIIKASLEEGSFSEDDVVNDLGAFFLAGHDTTASTLTTTFYYLSKHQERARAEVSRVLKGEDRAPTCEELKEMAYIDCIIKESMRIVSTATQLPRYCPAEEVLASGLVVPKGTAVVLSMWMVHHDPEIFPDPYAFRPERFAQAYGKQDAQWLPFGFGARMCIGKAFSLMEQRVVIATLVQKFVMRPGPVSQTEKGPKLNSFGLIHPVSADTIFDPIL